MTQLLDTLYASGGEDVIIPTVELFCTPWAGPIYFSHGFDDVTARTETGVTAKFQALGMAATLPKRDNSGNQTITIALDNVTGIAQQLIDRALEARAAIGMVFRIYTSGNLDAPSARPYRMKVLSGFMKGPSVQLNAGYFDLINLGWPRFFYTLDFAPCLRYI